MTGALPYGPNSRVVRQFLVQLAGLGADDRTRVVASYASVCDTAAWSEAERLLAEALTRSDREGYRDVLSGPLLQLVRRKDAPEPTTDEEAMAALDPIAEPALAALLSLLVRDLLDVATSARLLSPFAEIIDPTS